MDSKKRATERKKQGATTPLRPRHQLHQLALRVGCRLLSVGEIEQLAGVNIQSECEREELWFKFRHLFNGPPLQVMEAVMDYCSTIALSRIAAGDLSLVKTSYY